MDGVTLGLITAVVGLIATIIGIAGKLAKVCMDYQNLKTRVAINEERDEEERRKNSAKFTELYNSRNKTNDVITELSTTIRLLVTNINQQFSTLEKKIDELAKQHGGN